MKKLSILFIGIFTFVCISSAQNVTLKGRVKDIDSHTVLPGATVQLFKKGSTKLVDHSTTTNSEGYFQIENIEATEYTLTVSFVAYRAESLKLNLLNDSSLSISLNKEVYAIHEAVVTSLRHEKLVKDVPIPVEIVNAEKFREISAVSVSDILQNEPGVSLSRDGIWATSVNIRGLSEQRLITMIDGNRIETATDLAAAISMIDPEDLEKVEIIKGGASSLYGTGGLGGVVHFISKDAHFADNAYMQGEGSEYYASVNNMVNRRLSIEAGDKAWNVRLSGFLRDADNTETPEGELTNSQFSDQNFSASLGFKPLKNHTLKIRYQNYTAEDAGIPGGAPFPGPATATYLEAKREMYSANYKIDFNRKLENISINYFHQYIARDVEMIPNTPPKVTPSQIVTAQSIYPSGYHTSDGLQLQTMWKFNENHNLIFGVDAWQRKLETEREKNIQIEVLQAGEVIAINQMVKGEKPIPDAKFQSIGVFLQDEISILNDKVKLLIGGRYDYINIWNEEALDPMYTILNGTRNDSPANQRVTFEEGTEDNQSWSVNAGSVFKLNSDMDIALNFGRSFRSPSLEERFKYIDLGTRVRIGNPELDPEKAYNIDLAYRIWKQNFVFKAGFFANFLSDMIIEEDGEFIYSNVVDRSLDTLPALINANVDEARLYGFELSFNYQFLPGFSITGNGAFTRGENTKDDTSLPLIPPLNGRIGLQYKNDKVLTAEIVARGAADQVKLAAGEDKTAGYAVYDFYISSRKFDLRFVQLYFSGGIENIGDIAYRNHLATNRGGVQVEPGRNLFIKLRLTF